MRLLFGDGRSVTTQLKAVPSSFLPHILLSRARQTGTSLTYIIQVRPSHCGRLVARMAVERRSYATFPSTADTFPLFPLRSTWLTFSSLICLSEPTFRHGISTVQAIQAIRAGTSTSLCQSLPATHLWQFFRILGSHGGDEYSQPPYWAIRPYCDSSQM